MIWVFLILMCAGVFGTVFFSLELRQARIDAQDERTVSV
jgi:hypothetical protein